MIAKTGFHRRLLDGARRGRSKVSSDSNLQTLIILAIVAGLVVIAFIPKDDYATVLTNDITGASTTSFVSSPFKTDQNAQIMKTWRDETVQQCKAAFENSKNDDEAIKKKEEIEIDSISKFYLPDSETLPSSLPSGHVKYERCHNAFIDLGTNIGDSIGYFIDNALDVCGPLWMADHPKFRYKTQDFPHPHLDVTENKIYNKGSKGNPLQRMLQANMNKAPVVFPENTCVYGMEGNPTFTERLQKLENFVMNMRPRPIQHMHIHTESVVTAVDGPTKLYLDKMSVKENFWGSSILSSQQDAQKTAKELGNGTVFSADVDGISLTTLVKSTMLPFQTDVTPEEKKGGLLIVKMDVEGAEWQVLKEIAKSDVLCDYIRMGNRVIMIVEFHHMSITNAEERRREKGGAEAAKKKLEECGVEFGRLQAIWA